MLADFLVPRAVPVFCNKFCLQTICPGYSRGKFSIFLKNLFLEFVVRPTKLSENRVRRTNSVLRGPKVHPTNPLILRTGGSDVRTQVSQQILFNYSIGICFDSTTVSNFVKNFVLRIASSSVEPSENRARPASSVLERSKSSSGGPSVFTQELNLVIPSKKVQNWQ